MKSRVFRQFGFLFLVSTVFLATALLNVQPAFASPALTLLDPLAIPKFENQLSGPLPVFESTNVTDSKGNIIENDYTVTMSSFKEQMLPASMGLFTSVWGFGGLAKDAVTGASLGYVQSSPGPSFDAIRGVPVKVKWVNNVTSGYMLPVDPTIHWANPDNLPMPSAPFPSYPPGYSQVQSTVPLVVHLHGSETESSYDGGPNEWFTANGLHGPDYSTYEKTDPNAAVYYYPNAQPAATLWYHDHTLGLTRINVMSGLAGFYFIRDQNSTSDYVASTLPSGAYEIPLMIQDKSFYTDGSIAFTTVGDNPDIHPYWSEAFLGNTIAVNGKVWPNMNVNQGLYRLRLLDASNSRIYNLTFFDTQTNQTLPFSQIGTDGGYLRASVNMTSLFVAPAERMEILIDFSNLAPGTKVILENSALTNPSTEVQTVGQIMQFTVTSTQGFQGKTLPAILNPTLAGSTFPTLPTPTKQRILTMYAINGPNGPEQFLLNGQMWDGAVSELPQVGSTEDWVIVDLTRIAAHPIHLHLVQFQIVSRQNINATTYAADWLALQRQALGNATAAPPWPTDFIPKELPVQPYLIGSPRPAPPNEQGWKDTVLIYPFTVTIIRVRFAQQDGSPYPFDPTKGPGYVWHCHILDHEDNEMMRPYKLVSAASQSQNPLTLTLAISIAVAVTIVTLLVVLFFWRRRRNLKEVSHNSLTVAQ